jgi:hypothetical protein
LVLERLPRPDARVGIAVLTHTRLLAAVALGCAALLATGRQLEREDYE